MIRYIGLSAKCDTNIRMHTNYTYTVFAIRIISMN